MKDHPPGETISRYLDGELAGGEAARVEAHLEACPRCRKTAEKLGRAGDFLRLASAAGSLPPVSLAEAIAEKLFPRPGEVFLGMIEFDLSTLPDSPRAGLAMAAESPAGYGAPAAPATTGKYRRDLSGEGIAASVELFRGEEGAACRVGIRDERGIPLPGVRLQLEKGGKVIWSFLTRDGRGAVIPRLLPGRYSLRIEHGQTYGLILDLR